ncbi:glycosyltransferase family A protein [Sphingomonas sp. I4]
MPFFNEETHLAATLEGLAAQTVRFRLVLVDNGSLDASARIATETCERLGLDHILLHQGKPGKINALHLGLAHVHTLFVATCDADTHYPADYLAQAQALLEKPGCVVAGPISSARRTARRSVGASPPRSGWRGASCRGNAMRVARGRPFARRR